MTATPFRMDAGLARPLAGVLALVMIGGLVLGQFAGVAVADRVAMAAAVALALVRIAAVPRIAQVFVLLALAAAVAVAVAAPAQMPRMEQALLQGTAFSAFLTSLGLIRGPVRASRLVRTAAARLFAFPARGLGAAVTYGAQGLAVLFNIGTIAMMADIARDHAARAQAEGRPGIVPREVILAAMRGTVMTTVWNPIGVGFAIVTSAIPALDPVVFLGLSFAVAMLITLGALPFGRLRAADPEARLSAAETRAGNRAILALVAAICGLIAVTVALHRVADVGFLVAACLVLPVLAALWPLVEPSVRGAGGPRQVMATLSEATQSTAAEATIFLAAAVIGAAVAIGCDSLGLEGLIRSGALPALAVVLGCLVLVPLAGALLIPHSIVMVLIAQLFGAGPVGAAHPLALALALCLAWALAIAGSPISAMSIITGRLLATTPARMAFSVNRAFTLYALAAAGCAVLAVYFCE